MQDGTMQSRISIGVADKDGFCARELKLRCLEIGYAIIAGRNGFAFAPFGPDLCLDDNSALVIGIVYIGNGLRLRGSIPRYYGIGSTQFTHV